MKLILLKTSLFQDYNSRYSRDLIASSLNFLEGTDENERQVELEKLSKHPYGIVAVDWIFEKPLQNTCRSFSKHYVKNQI